MIALGRTGWDESSRMLSDEFDRSKDDMGFWLESISIFWGLSWPDRARCNMFAVVGWEMASHKDRHLRTENEA